MHLRKKMKPSGYICIFIFVLKSIGPASAANGSADIKAWEKFCVTYASSGKSIMMKRQEGVPMVKQVALADTNTDPLIRGALRAMITDAYKSPRFESPEYQRKTAQDYEDQIYRGCLEKKK